MEQVKHREWVKNAAIIFLSVLLVLTFFSNTILNHSLPEVAAKQVAPGTVTAQVRGTGTVTADGEYEVKAISSREIRAVMTKPGQTVKAGDILFVLGSGDSEELEQAQEQLRQLQNSYSKTAVSSGGQDYTGINLQIKVANENIAQAEKALKQAEEQAQISDSVLWATVKAAKVRLDAANSEVMALYGEQDPDTGKYAKYDGLKDQITQSQSKIDDYAAQIAALPTDAEDYEAQKSALETAKTAEETVKLNLTNDFETLCSNITAAEAKANSCRTDYDAAYLAATANNTELLAAQSALAEARNTAAALQAQKTSMEASDNKSAAAVGIDLWDLSQQIEKAQAKVFELSGGMENSIVAEVSGTVDQVLITAGNTAKKGDVLCTIEVPESGYSLSFSVTNDQAKRLHVGDTATISNYYWGKEIKATLTSIARDIKNPTSNKTLTFDIQGDVSAGSELSITIGSRGASYDLILPNSAIRTDSNGSFVLAIQEKSSPLGNRYFAKRVGVEILAQDDVNAAVTAELNNGDFVITTATRPISSGDQIRMAD